MKRLFYTTVGPMSLLLLCPPVALLMWYFNAYDHASFSHFQLRDFLNTLSVIALGTKTSWTILAVFAGVELLLMRLLPGKAFHGPVSPAGNTPIYKANGLFAFLVTIGLYVLCSFGLGLFSPTLIYDNFGPLLCSSCLFSLLFCLFLYVKGRFFPSSSDHSSSGNFIFDYYWGTELYPRLFGFDVKHFTNCRFGMMSWGLIILSFAAKQHALYGISNAMLLSVALQLIYITKFFIWETGYLRSLDIMHDRAGFYLCWGCLVWVPAIYTSPALYLVHHPLTLSLPAFFFILVLGCSAILINFLADRQRQHLRASGGTCLVWGKPPKVTHARYITSEGEERSNLLLASGWWGLSRHFHYVPEILGAFCWSVPALFASPIPYFYVLFLTAVLVERSFRDDRRCRKKYGEDWDKHLEAVPYRFIPYVF